MYIFYVMWGSCWRITFVIKYVTVAILKHVMPLIIIISEVYNIKQTEERDVEIMLSL